ncbi:CRISPR-associated protein Cas4 [Alkanindiges illinoisensis]|uniref:CRISPR-associated exonuclease Cas4 n=1 Tax=Alkanindiges illinoisensis TaxID=197183 RepID=A0A4Y7XEE5_9GAMM|nr:CRISPR-associated protein Cas4 [Alkanindiges illinoisensis]TEU30167.1 CRISPR-associated protein Cas4 [Alkanindiges illinoisensis]
METIYLSRLQHYLYCPRQFALIELEDIWTENYFTASGQVLHQRVNQQDQQKRGKIRTAWALPLASERLGIEGVADVVEFHRQPDGSELPYPIEYKRGKPKSHQADEVQLCAQALCLEEMQNVVIPQGALFYGETRRRQNIEFDQQLQDLTLNTIQACREIVKTGSTPAAIFDSKKCRACSLIELCHPKKFKKSASLWLAKHLQAE